MADKIRIEAIPADPNENRKREEQERLQLNNNAIEVVDAKDGSNVIISELGLPLIGFSSESGSQNNIDLSSWPRFASSNTNNTLEYRTNQSRIVDMEGITSKEDLKNSYVDAEGYIRIHGPGVDVFAATPEGQRLVHREKDQNGIETLWLPIQEVQLVADNQIYVSKNAQGEQVEERGTFIVTYDEDKKSSSITAPDLKGMVAGYFITDSGVKEIRFFEQLHDKALKRFNKIFERNKSINKNKDIETVAQEKVEGDKAQSSRLQVIHESLGGPSAITVTFDDMVILREINVFRGGRRTTVFRLLLEDNDPKKNFYFYTPRGERVDIDEQGELTITELQQRQ